MAKQRQDIQLQLKNSDPSSGFFYNEKNQIKNVAWFSDSRAQQGKSHANHYFNRRDSLFTEDISVAPKKNLRDQIVDELEKLSTDPNKDLKHRQTKIICTLGKQTMQVNALVQMAKKGMDVARINMNYFDFDEQFESVNNVRKACEISGKELAIMVDLKGPLIRTLGFKDKYSVKVFENQEIRLSSNQDLLGDDGMFVIDYPNLHEKVIIGDKILVDYGGIIFTVIGFELESKYLASTGVQNQGENQSDHKVKHQITHAKDDLDRDLNEQFHEIIDEAKEEDEDIDNKLSKLYPNMVPQQNSIKGQNDLYNTIVQELEQEQAIFKEVLKKRAQGSNALNLTLKIDRANKRKSNSLMVNDQTSFSSDTSQTKKSFSAYKMKRNESQDTETLEQVVPLTPGQKRHSISPMDFEQKKRFSRDERLGKLGFFQIKSKFRKRRCDSPSGKSVGHKSQLGSSQSGISNDSDSILNGKLSPDRKKSDLCQPLISKDRMMIICRAENEGELKEKKPIYIPGLDFNKDLNLSVLGDKDIKILQNAMAQGVHMIAVSCVESRDDIIMVKKVMGLKGQHIRVLAKLQSQKALENFEQILEVSDGIIIARGYLGYSLDLEDIVYVQRHIIKQCNIVGKPVILSTQIIESMVKMQKPTRAEVVDISNAVYDGIDSFILSPETAVGEHYELVTETFSNILYQAEKHIDYRKRWQDQLRLLKTHITRSMENDKYSVAEKYWLTEETISDCAVKASFDVQASLIIVFTHSGITGRKVVKYKPKCPVLAVTPNEWAAKSLLINRGCFTMVVGSLTVYDTLLSKVIEEAINRKLVVPGNFVVVTSGLSGSVASTNLLKIFKI